MFRPSGMNDIAVRDRLTAAIGATHLILLKPGRPSHVVLPVVAAAWSLL